MDITQAEPGIRGDDLIGTHSQIFVPHITHHSALITVFALPSALKEQSAAGLSADLSLHPVRPTFV
jgi:hypothetical protein